MTDSSAPKASDVLSKLLPNLLDRDRWLQVVYAETWKQYAHEDQLVASRANVFLAVQAALLAVLAAASISIVKVGCANLMHTNAKVHLGVVLLGATWVAVAAVLLGLSHYFRRVTKAGRHYVNLRGAHLRALEHLTVGQLGPALVEDQWREHSKEPRAEEYPLLKALEFEPGEADVAKAIKVEAFEHFGAFKYLFRVITVWQVVYWVVFVLGLLAFWFGVDLSPLENWFGISVAALQC